MNVHLSAQDKLRLQLLKTAIDCDYTSFDYTLKQLRERFKLSDHKLRYGFETMHGIGIIDYQTKKRLEHITKLLRDENVSLSAAMYDAGFHDYSTFYRVFKREFKMAPKRYRQILKNKTAMFSVEAKANIVF